MVELLFILQYCTVHVCERNDVAVMCGIIASLDVEWMIYLNCQTKPSDHRLTEAKGPVGRVGTVSVERNSRQPPPPPKFTQAHQKPTRRRCKERVMTRSLSLSPVWSMTTNLLNGIRAELFSDSLLHNCFSITWHSFYAFITGEDWLIQKAPEAQPLLLTRCRRPSWWQGRGGGSGRPS